MFLKHIGVFKLSHICSVSALWAMGKRYYCDYCDRSFQDNMHNRKKHLFGVQHHRAKKAWFDTSEVLTENFTKRSEAIKQLIWDDQVFSVYFQTLPHF